MAAVCPKLQNGGQNDTFDQMRIGHCILPVIVIEVSILTFLGTKNTFSSFSKLKMAVTYKKIQNGRQNDA